MDEEKVSNEEKYPFLDEYDSFYENPLTSTERALLTGRAKADYLFEERHQNFAQDCLEAHNICRFFHSTPPLELSKKLCKQSRIWARYLAKIGQMETRFNCIFGENIFLVWPSKADYIVKGGEPVDYWYNGIRDYNFGCDPRNLLCLQFTQMIWADSKKFGVGIARGNDGKIFVVANYEPCGNVMGQFAKQVPPSEDEDGVLPVAGVAMGDCEGVDRPFSATERDCLRLQNDLRRRHDVPLLTLNSALSNMAATWAKKLVDEDRHAYRIDNPLGENVFSIVGGSVRMRSSQMGVRLAVESWYAEMKFFEFGFEPADIKARNLTQMLWRSTRLVGIGVAKGRRGRVVVVANYYPRGNIVGFYRDNVPPPLGAPSAVAASTAAAAAISIAVDAAADAAETASSAVDADTTDDGAVSDY